MQQYGLNPYGESESYEGELEFGAEAQMPGEFEVQDAEAEFGGSAEFGEYQEHQPGQAQQFGEAGPASMASLESPLSEEEELQLASELLEVTSEAELEQFLGNLFKGAAQRVGGFLRSPVGRALGGMLKNVARKALPGVGGAIGTAIAPGIGTAIGTRVGSWASGLFEVPAEGADHEELEFEVARRYTRLAATAAGNAALGSRRAAPPQVARDALLSAARRHAPGVARRYRVFERPAPWYWPNPVPADNGGQTAYGQAPEDPQGWGPEESVPVAEGLGAGASGPGRARSGRWVRQGRKIVLLGL